MSPDAGMFSALSRLLTDESKTFQTCEILLCSQRSSVLLQRSQTSIFPAQSSVLWSRAPSTDIWALICPGGAKLLFASAFSSFSSRLSQPVNEPESETRRPADWSEGWWTAWNTVLFQTFIGSKTTLETSVVKVKTLLTPVSIWYKQLALCSVTSSKSQ